MPEEQPRHRKQNQAVHEEIRDCTQDLFSQLADTLPENNYWSLASYSILAPEILDYLFSYSLPQSEALGATWNYVDAACQGITGLKQWFDTATHRPAVSKGKGLLNLASSIQLITLTIISVSALGPIGFAAATGTSFLLSMDESMRQMRRLFNPEYFFVDSLAELDKVETLIENKEKRLAALRTLPDKDRLSKSGRLALKLVRSSLNNLQQRRISLHREMKIKLDMDLIDHGENSPLLALTIDLQQYRQNDLIDQLSQRKRPERGSPEEAQAIQAAQRLKAQTEFALGSAVSESYLWAIAFTGMVLLCIPGMQAVSFGFITAASLFFMVKNGAQLTAKVGQMSRFFKKTAPELDTEETTPNEAKRTPKET